MTQVSPGDTKIVDVKSAWASKINWFAGLTALGTTLNELLPLVPPSWQHYVSVAIVLIGGAALIYTRTFATTSITPASAAKI